MKEVLIIINAILLGIILVTQIVSYPLFCFVRNSDFTNYHRAYTHRISIVVLPFMLSELILTIYTLVLNPSPIYLYTFLILLFIWFSTFFIQVPIHNMISKSASRQLINKLVITNWLRTSLWSIKLSILILL
jgi:hypothetical protein